MLFRSAVGYGLSLDSVAELRNQGFSVFKIKIGSDPDKDGNVEKMLKWDCERISSIHSLIGNMLDSEEAPPLYYLDANSRYPSISSVQRLADHIEQIGALSQTILLEEPLQNFRSEPVHQIPITVVADESATDIQTVNELIDLGYGAVALKPIAKTLSKTLQVAELCNQRGIASFCADLTVNPAMLDWNRTIAARLDSIPGLSSGLMETNGFQNYADWKRLSSFHPQPDAGWTQMVDGKFVLDPGFFDNNGCIFDALPHYESLTHNG